MAAISRREMVTHEASGKRPLRGVRARRSVESDDTAFNLRCDCVDDQRGSDLAGGGVDQPRGFGEHVVAVGAGEDGRSVYLNGARINTVTRHKAYSGAARSIARLYDFQCAPENLERMTFESPQTGDRVGRMWQLPRSHGDLVARREALVAWAETHFGFMGRSPDHVASTIAGFCMGSGVYRGPREGAVAGSARLLCLRAGPGPLPLLRHHRSAGRSLEDAE